MSGLDKTPGPARELLHAILRRYSAAAVAHAGRILEFPPGAAWIVFTDAVPHAVESGQYVMGQTLLVPRETLASPQRAPIAILERLAGLRPRVGAYGAVAIVTWLVVVTPFITICKEMALPAGVVGAGMTPIWYSLTYCGDSTA